MKKQATNRYISLVLAAIVLVCFLAGGLLHIFSLSRRSAEESVRYLDDATKERAAAVEQQVRGDLQLLRGVAISLGEMDLSDSASVDNILDTINQTNTFVRMGLADVNGIVDLLDLNGSVYAGVDLSGYAFFRQALGGQDAVSETFRAPWSGEYVNYFAVPVSQNGEVVGVLCAAETDAIFREIISTPVFQGAGYFAIIDENGILVGPSVNPDPAMVLGADVFDAVSLTPEDEAALRRALAEGTEARLAFTYGGERQLAISEPLNINNWSVLSAVPRSEIYGYYNSTAIGTTIIILLAFAIFVVLFMVQFRTSGQNQKALEYLAYTDLLTGQRNYTKFLIDAQKQLDENPGVKYAVWNYDIKKFYAINDVFGRPTGDLVLKRVASVFAADEKNGTLFCRVSADNFAGIRPYQTKEDLERWYDWVIETLAGREVIPENQMRIDEVIGFFCIGDFPEKLSVDEMVTRAGVAKRGAKGEPGNSLAYFNDAMGTNLHWETELEASGAEALASGQITFFLQPKVSIQNGYRIAGAEALARWNHPDHGRIPPDQFIPLFEKNGFVVEIDRALFERVCQWYKANIEGQWPNIRLSVNVSRQGLMRDDFVEHYIYVKQKYGILDGVMELEFTESVILDNTQLFLDNVLTLQKHGFICSIDDFGSGYSSLNVLKNLPIDVLKLDAMFFRQSIDAKREQIVVAGFLALANKLEISTVAEGVETFEQVDFLRGAGCDIVQGYAFARPMPKEEYLFLLQETNGILTTDRTAKN